MLRRRWDRQAHITSEAHKTSAVNKETRLAIKRPMPFGVLSAVNSAGNRDKSEQQAREIAESYPDSQSD